ncbi:CDP-alcohol phosphatidyltransferase family protein [Rhizobium mongolense]|uniref:CDP-alcohol phosphatidyltransferase family protein n=1 Tax=Rhizobium mongolense TaxID=57676 RepID=UPI0035574D30
MIRQLADPANAVTAAGIVLSTIGISLAVTGHAQAGVAVTLWAVLADHLDGVLAKRTAGRLPETAQIGKKLDSLADLGADHPRDPTCCSPSRPANGRRDVHHRDRLCSGLVRSPCSPRDMTQTQRLMTHPGPILKGDSHGRLC